MEIAKVTVSGVQATTACYQDIPRGIIGAKVRFEFTDPIWNRLSKTVVFKGNGTRDAVITDGCAVLPADITASVGARISVGVYGVDADNKVVIPTLWAVLGTVKAAADPSGDFGADPDLPYWAQIKAMVGELDDLDTESKGAIVAAINEVLAKKPVKGVDYYTDADKEEMVNLVLASLPNGDEVSY